MSFLHFRTQAHHLPELELELDPPALDAGRSADEADYAEEHAREALAAEMAALRSAAPPVEPDPDGARLMAEYAADKLAAELAAAAHQAQCDAGGAAADRDAIAARRRRLMALALSGGAGRVAQRKAMAARRPS